MTVHDFGQRVNTPPAPDLPGHLERLTFVGIYQWADTPRPEAWAEDAQGELWVAVFRRGNWSRFRPNF